MTLVARALSLSCQVMLAGWTSSESDLEPLNTALLNYSESLASDRSLVSAFGIAFFQSMYKDSEMAIWETGMEVCFTTLVLLMIDSCGIPIMIE